MKNQSKGIPHIESLPAREFIHVLENIDRFTVTEKLDGVNLTFGFDNNGTLYSSRENKGGKRFYDGSDFDNSPANISIKNAHNAINSVSAELHKIVGGGNSVECEILFGKQPNAIVYGSNHIVFLRMVVGDNKQLPDPTKIIQLGEQFKHIVKRSNTITIVSDGINLTYNGCDRPWKFTGVPVIDNSQLTSVDVSPYVSNYKVWLNIQHPIGMANEALLNANLNHFPVIDRAVVKAAREQARHISLVHFKLPIKEKFLDSVLRVLTPALRDCEVDPDSDIGVEGLVLLIPETLYQTKIVDKDMFTIINQFNYAIRNEIKRLSMGTAGFNASLGNDGDIFGSMLSDIATTHGMLELTKYNNIKRTMRKFKGDTLEQTLDNVVEQLTITKHATLQSKSLYIIDRYLKMLSDSLHKYQQEWPTYHLFLTTGNVLRYSEEIHQRTLVVFADIRLEMSNMKHNIAISTSTSEYLLAIYGKLLKPIH
jgi:hypothetical protein